MARARAATAVSAVPHQAAKRAAIYGRVSTKKDEQKNALEASLERLGDYARLRGFCVTLVLKDRLSGTSATDRKDYQLLRDLVRRREVDVVVATKLDRIARSLKELMAFFEEATHVGVEIVLVDQAIDTGTASGKFLLHVLGAVAEFESELIRDRIARGLETARRRGHRLGRPRAHADLLPRAQEMLAAGTPERAVARQLGVAPSWVRRNVARLRVDGPQGATSTTDPAPDRPDSGTPS